MKLFLISSKRFYDRIPPIREALEARGHVITLPNCYDDPTTEARYRELGCEEHAKWKAEMFAHSTMIIAEHDAVLVLNFEKDGMQNYIGGATFLEMYDAFKLGKRIFLFNAIPEGMLADEIAGFAPVVIQGDIARIV